MIQKEIEIKSRQVITSQEQLSGTILTAQISFQLETLLVKYIQFWLCFSILSTSES